MTRIKVVNGLSLPFFPMRPVKGVAVCTAKAAEALHAEIADTHLWTIQPKLGGDRACLAVVDDKVYVQNRLGSWYKHPVKNAEAFKELGNGTCFDGEVYDGRFCVFDLLALKGKSFVRASAGEREVMARATVQLIGQPWVFDPPSRAWLCKLRRNGPQWEGVVLKRTLSPYIPLGSATQSSPNWIKKLFASRSHQPN